MRDFSSKKKHRILQSEGGGNRSSGDENMFSSRNQPDIRPDGPDPLGSDYEPRDRDMDIMVGEFLRQIPVSEGLVDRVQQASLARRQQSRMRIGPSRATIAFKRLALAACVGIAAVAAFWMTGPQLVPTAVTPIVDARPEQLVEFPMEFLAKADGSGLLVSHDLTWAEAHDELLSILEAEHNSDSWGYLAVEIR